MSYTKRQFVTDAFEEIGMAEYDFDVQPEQLRGALRRLDAMIAEWNARGIRLSYPLPSSPELSDLDDETGVPDIANQAIVTNLACRIAPGFGKQVLSATMATASHSLDTLYARFSEIRQRELPGTMPSGQGNKGWREHKAFLPDPVEPLEAGPDSAFDFS